MRFFLFAMLLIISCSNSNMQKTSNQVDVPANKIETNNGYPQFSAIEHLKSLSYTLGDTNSLDIIYVNEVFKKATQTFLKTDSAITIYSTFFFINETDSTNIFIHKIIPHQNLYTAEYNDSLFYISSGKIPTTYRIISNDSIFYILSKRGFDFDSSILKNEHITTLIKENFK